MSSGRFTPRTAQEWGAVLPQYVGMGGLLLCFVFWAVTGRVEPLFLTVFGGLIAAGQASEAVTRLKRGDPEAPPPPAAPPVPDSTVGDPPEVAQ